MEILDLRPGVVRRFNRSWDGASSRGDGSVVERPGPLARWVGRVTDQVVARRAGGRPQPPSGPQLVSVGNLAVGGTGKTPVAMALARDLADRGRTGAVLTRGFGSPLKGPLVVTRENSRAGDEARLMAWKLDDLPWSVVQARRRPDGLAFIRDTFPELDYVLLEDAHQTRNLPRHLDVLLLDGWEVATNESGSVVVPRTGPVFPFGPWRESARGARRAGILLMETADTMPGRGREGQAVGTFTRTLGLRDTDDRPLAELPAGPYALLSGIARPAAFERAVAQAVGRPAELSIRCRDHAKYRPRLLDRITAAVATARTETLVTTFKDWVKLAPWTPAGVEVVLVDLEVVWGLNGALPELVEECLGR